MTYPDTQKLADAFVAVLKDWLTPGEWRQMLLRNAIHRRPGVCASHDFCDANVAMAEAWQTLTGEEPDVSDEKATRVWNQAWELAMPKLTSQADA